MKTINEFAYGSRLKNVSPVLKIIFGMAVLTANLVLNSASASVFVICAMFFISVRNSGVSSKQYADMLLIPLSFLILAVLPVIFGIGADENGFKIVWSQKSIFDGILIFIKSVGAISCMYFITLTTTMNDIMYGLKLMKIPRMIISLMELIYRYIFVLFDEMQKIKTAQKSRLGYKNYKTSIISTGQLIAALFAKTYSKCDRVYNALQSRGYRGEISVLENEYTVKKSMIAVMLVIIAVMVIMALGEKEIIRWIL